ncbi:MAG: hypothetical protein AB7S57_10305 [Acetobacteraceae bacterium]
MSTSPEPLLGELPEDRATGRLAEIYDEIRRFSGVPYVSSLQRYVATMPGALEWAWDTLRPALASGTIPETGWRLARDVRIPPPGRVSGDRLRAWGITPADLAAIRNVAENFVRVSPVNLMTGACLALLLTGTRPAGRGFGRTWTPPAMLAPMPGNIDPLALPDGQRAVLMRFVTEVDGKPFVPALYRQIAHWPAVLAWLAEELAPRFNAPETNAARADFRAAARAAAPEIVAHLPPVSMDGAPDAPTVARILATIDRYAETSPEMTMFGQLILDALPARLDD